VVLKAPRRARVRRVCLVVAAVATGFTAMTAAVRMPSTQANTKLPVIAFLGGNRPVLDWVLTGLRDTGYVAERDFHLEVRLTGGSPEKESQFAAEIVGLQPAVVVATGNAAIELTKRTSVLPVVLTNTPENIALRMMDSLEHPGRNVTGVVERPALRTQKELSLLKEVLPGLRRLAVLTGGFRVGVLPAFAAANGIQFDVVDFSSADELDRAFDKLATNSPQALFLGGGPLTLANMSTIASLAGARKWPSMSENSELPRYGGLMSYGSNGGYGDPRQVAQYVDRILKGAKPGDLPAMVPEPHWDLVINLKSAKQLGLTIPQSVLAQAAEILR
jgi:putative ABC transport system substrate-binding protein